MPTQHPRTYVTHTAAVVRALEIARREWPDDRESALITHLLTAGADALEQRREHDRQQHVQALRALAGRYGDRYSEDYLEDLREGWGE